jgi:hypothetical protein
LTLFTSYAQDFHMPSASVSFRAPAERSFASNAPTGRKYLIPAPAHRKGGSLLVNPPYLDKSRIGAEICDKPTVTLFKTGARVNWRFVSPKVKARLPDAKRGEIGDMSSKARLRAAFAFSNAPFDWEWMITLTRRHQPENPKADFDKFTRAMRARFNMACQWGWMMEYQGRGVVHHHIFLSADFVDRNFDRSRLEFRDVVRDGQNTTLVAGSFDSWVVDQWCAAVGDTSKAFRAFQAGGIVEVFRLPDAAARYIAKEANKRCQKKLPKGVKGGRKWWWLSPAGRAVSTGSARLNSWPFETLVSRVFDKTQLAGCLTPMPAYSAKPATFAVDIQQEF